MIFSTLLVILGCFFGFANPVVQLPLAALLAPAGLHLLGLDAERGGQAFRRGWIAGGLGSSAALYWVALPVHDYGYLPWALAVPCAMLLGFALGFFHGLFSYAVFKVARRLPLVPAGVLAGCAWGLLEAARGHALTGFPWLVLPAAFAPWPLCIQGLSVVGAWGLAALMAMAACWQAHGAWRRRVFGASALPGLVLAILALGAIFGHGLATLQARLVYEDMALVGVVQGNVDQSVKWNEAYQQETIDRYVSLTRAAAGRMQPATADVILWPETAMPFYLQENSPASRQVRSLAQDLATPLVVGAPGYERPDGAVDERQYRFFNRAYLIDRTGEFLSAYDKEHLVPFGEYIPYGDYLKFLEKMVEGPGDFTPGVRTAPLSLGRLSLGMLVCYETIFPELAQKRVADGATLLVNISNDAWFGNSSAPMQHLHLAVLRAVEQRRTLVRATNTGVSAVILPTGVVNATTRLFETAVFHQEAPLSSEFSQYHRWHDMILPCLGGLGMLCFLWSRLVPSREPPRSGGRFD